MNARDLCYFCKKAIGSTYTFYWGNKAHIACEAANELPSLKRKVEAAGFLIMKKEDVEAIRDKALEAAARILAERRINVLSLLNDTSLAVENEAMEIAIRSLKSEARG